MPTIRSFLVAALLVVSFVPFAHAATTTPPPSTVTTTTPPPSTGTQGSETLINPLGTGTTLEVFLQRILAVVIRVGSIVVILMLVYTGYEFVAARGAPAEIEKAKRMLLWTVVGALILLGAQAIASGILATIQALGG